MNMYRLIISLMLMLAVASVSACGGGGGGGGGTAAAQPTTAVLTLSTSGTSTTIFGIEVTVLLPDGVTVQTKLNSSETGTGVVTASGSALGGMVIGSYTAATGTTPGRVKVAVPSSGGYAVGEFAIVNCDISAGHSPLVTDFSLSGFLASGPTGLTLGGLTPGFTAEIR
jgi:hypothetical protein